MSAGAVQLAPMAAWLHSMHTVHGGKWSEMTLHDFTSFSMMMASEQIFNPISPLLDSRHFSGAHLRGVEELAFRLAPVTDGLEMNQLAGRHVTQVQRESGAAIVLLESHLISELFADLSSVSKQHWAFHFF